ncbi:MAG: hypothetical protein WCC14_13340 [Acidobacteriaceae bacterium]
MPGTPNTIGLILLFVVLFFASILWATHGATGVHDSQEQDLQSMDEPT